MKTCRRSVLLGLLLPALLLASCLAAGAADEIPATWVNGKDYVTVASLARIYGFKIEGPAGRALALVGKSTRLVFTTNGREVLVNGALVWLHEPMVAYRGRWMLRAVDARKVIDPLVRPSLHLQQAGYRVIVLDPGHGGQDTGTKGARRVEEKRVVLDLVRRVRNILTKAGYLVYVTRDSDRFLELDERTRKAKALGADLFVSIHLNSAPTSEPNGTETFALPAAGFASTSGGESAGVQTGNKFDGANTALAYLVHKALCSRIGEGDRGLKRARFMVLKTASCPAALVECAFLSNPREEERLLDDGFRDEVAAGIAKGVQDYMTAVKRARIQAP